MKKETLLRALDAVRAKIITASDKASGWLAERDRRRRQEAAFIRGIVRIEGSMRKAAAAIGISPMTVSRTLNPEGHEMHRKDQAERDQASVSRNQNLGTPSNVVQLPRYVVPPGAKTLRDLIDPKENYWGHKRVHDVVLALDRCSSAEAAFLCVRGLPKLARSLTARLFKPEEEKEDQA